MANEYLIQRGTLDNIANQSNNLVGKTSAVSPDTIVSDLTEVNSKISAQINLIEEQNDKIAELAEILASKAGGSGGSSSNVEAWTGIIAVEKSPNLSSTKIAHYTDESMIHRTIEIPVVMSSSDPVAEITIAANTIIYIADFRGYINGNYIELLDEETYDISAFLPIRDNFAAWLTK